MSRTQYRLVIKNKNLKPKKWVLWAIREQIFTSKNGERLNIDTKNPLDVIEKGDAKSLKKEFYNEYSSKIESFMESSKQMIESARRAVEMHRSMVSVINQEATRSAIEIPIVTLSDIHKEAKRALERQHNYIVRGFKNNVREAMLQSFDFTGSISQLADLARESMLVTPKVHLSILSDYRLVSHERIKSLNDLTTNWSKIVALQDDDSNIFENIQEIREAQGVYEKHPNVLIERVLHDTTELKPDENTEVLCIYNDGTLPQVGYCVHLPRNSLKPTYYDWRDGKTHNPIPPPVQWVILKELLVLLKQSK